MSADPVDHSEEAPHAHDNATEVAHAWEHFHQNWKFFICFFGVVLLTVITWSINFGPKWNVFFVFLTAAMRCGLIAYFMATLFKPFSFVIRTFIFSAIFLAGMIFLSMWDSELRTIGDPIKDRVNVSPESHVP